MTTLSNQPAVAFRFKSDPTVQAALRLRGRIYKLEAELEVAEQTLAAVINTFTNEQMLAYGERTAQ